MEATQVTRILDSHVHLKHGDLARTEYSPDIIVRTMDAAGIERAVVFAMSTTTSESIAMAERAVRAFPDRLIPYAYALPSYERPVLAELEDAIANRGFKGIKIHAGECALREYIVDPVLALAGRLGVPCLIDAAGNLGATERLVAAFPGTTIIVAHMGQYLCTNGRLIDQFVDLAVRHGNALLDLSGVVLSWKIEDAVRRLGSERLLFGTDGPDKAPDTASHARLELAKIRMLDLSAADRESILGGNLVRLLRLP